MQSKSESEFLPSGHIYMKSNLKKKTFSYKYIFSLVWTNLKLYFKGLDGLTESLHS